jgi:hypothetical protein
MPVTNKQLEQVRLELTAKAQADSNKCFGYFPGMKLKANLDFDLPESAKLEASAPTLKLNDKLLHFNFVRLSLVKQSANSPYHLDSDAATALTGDTSTISKRLVWRLLLNLSDQHARTLSYLDLDPSSVKLETSGGYIHCADTTPEDTIRRIAIPPRQDGQVHGVLFCASRVLHTGQDDEHGHFVAGYGCEENPT